MLESLRALVQKWSWTNRKIANDTSTKLTNKYEKILKNNYFYSANMTVNSSNDSVFEVCNVDKKSIVNLAAKSCTCNRFQMDQLSCAHAIAVLKKVNHDPYEYCSSYYTKEAMIAAYTELVYRIGKKDTWKVPKVIKARKMYSQKGRVGIGRPKKRRRKGAWEANMTIQQFTYGKCNQAGHNKRTCKNPPSKKKLSYLQIMLQILHCLVD
ncbi:SWIM-type domain-containing protein [Heracleum sosnowskyi]|uniref:SWIM-type domain-containing protein n=1 Tax=Heracleum sosnowskyi TaxID=360622 RepID=A0AAD8JG92_9APIA|nr:SWIM-type domain-containing protein [Heracleum sosnowskyi]